MSRHARLLIALLVAVLVPLQGLAAMTAGVCMAMGHHDAAHSGHGHGSDEGHEDGTHHGSDQEPAAHCAPCVACCAAACIAPAPQSAFLDTAPEAVLTAFPDGRFGFVPDALDRPPLPL